MPRLFSAIPLTKGGIRATISSMNRDYLKTPIGVLRIETENDKIREIYLLRDGEHITDEPCAKDPLIDEAKRQLTEYFEGKRTIFNLELDFGAGSEFQQRVWKTLTEIPYGETMSYGQVAEAAGSPKGARACGNAVGANPFLIVVPCHRVIKGDGTIGGFSSGLDKKKILFGVEGIDLCRK